MHWLMDVDNVYGYGTLRTAGSPAQHACRTSTPTSAARRSRSGRPSPTRPARLRRSAARQRLPAAVHRRHALRQAVALHRRPRRRRPRHPGRVLGADLGDRAGQRSPHVAATVAKAAKMGDYLRYAMYDKYFKKPGCTSTALRRRHRQGAARTYLLSWYYAWGGDARRPVVVAHRLQPQPPGLPEPARGVGAVQRRSGRCSRVSPTAKRGLGDQPRAGSSSSITWLQSAEGAIAGGATNSWDGAYSAPAVRHADVLRHGVRLPAGVPRPAVEPVVRLPGVVDGAGGGVLLRRPVTPRPRRCSTSGSPGRSRTPRWAPDGDFQIPSTRWPWTGAPATAGTRASPAANTGLHVSVVRLQQRRRRRRRVRPDADVLRGQGPAAAGRPRPRPRACSTACWLHTDDQGRRHAGDPDRLQPVRRRLDLVQPAGPVHPAGLQRHHAQR